MKIKNQEVSIKIGKKEHKFTNMILNNYLDLFASSFVEFQNKELLLCFLSFTEPNYDINENSTEMDYDVILEADLNKQTEILSPKSITNKYFYNTEIFGKISDYNGETIKGIGFGQYNSTGGYTIYAFLDVMRYNITAQENQPIAVSRVDKIETDMEFYSPSNLVKGPIHLTKKGMLNLFGMNYTTIIPKLYSIGFGVLPYKLDKEYLTEELTIQKTGTGVLEVNNQLEVEYLKGLYFKDNLYMSDSLKLQKPSYPLLIYKFKLFEETYPDPEEPAVFVDTGKWYTQYKKLDKYGKINLKIKYERG